VNARIPCFAASFVALAIALAAPPARAQRLLLAADVDAASGVEGGTYLGGVGIRRARTTLRFGVDGSIDETPENIVAAALLIELEPHASLGAEVRLMRNVWKGLTLEIGATGYLAPATLFGATVGATYRIPLFSTFSFTIGPALNGYFIGSDLPSGTILWQGLVRGGLRVTF
jgi:hypothetical protein